MEQEERIVDRHIFSHKNSNRIYNSKGNLYNYPSQKFSRKFLTDLCRDFSNKNGIGLFTYVELIANAITSSNYNKCKQWYFRYLAFVNMKDKDMEPLFGKDFRNPRAKNDVESDLEFLSALDLVEYGSDNRSHYAYLKTCPSRHEADKKRLVYEYATVKGHQGYVFLSGSEAEKIIRAGRDAGKRFSECDAIVDLLMHTLYRESEFSITESCPMVLYDRETFFFSQTVRSLASRWGMSTGKVHAFLKKLNESGLFQCVFLKNKGVYIGVPAYAESLYGEKAKVSLWEVYHDAYHRENAQGYYFRDLKKRILDFWKYKKQNVKPVVRVHFVNGFKMKIASVLSSRGVHFLHALLSYKNSKTCRSNQVFS